MSLPPLKCLHSALIPLKLEKLRVWSTSELVASRALGRPDCLKVKANGTVMDGNHRIGILRPRGIDVDVLPREPMPFSQGGS